MGKKTPELTVKVVLLGSSNVGKTSLVEQYALGEFKETQPNTIGAAFCQKQEEVNGRCVKLQLWDTGGQERYRAMSSLYYRGAKVAIVCYDVTESRSLDGIHFWISDLQKHQPDCSIYLCGTKIDLLNGKNNNLCDKKNFGVSKVPVTQTCIRNIAGSYGISTDHIYETSSKTKQGVGTLFLCIATDLSTCPIDVEESGDRFSVMDRSSMGLEEDATKPRGRCC